MVRKVIIVISVLLLAGCSPSSKQKKVAARPAAKNPAPAPDPSLLNPGTTDSGINSSGTNEAPPVDQVQPRKVGPHRQIPPDDRRQQDDQAQQAPSGAEAPDSGVTAVPKTSNPPPPADEVSPAAPRQQKKVEAETPPPQPPKTAPPESILFPPPTGTDAVRINTINGDAQSTHPREIDVRPDDVVSLSADRFLVAQGNQPAGLPESSFTWNTNLPDDQCDPGRDENCLTHSNFQTSDQGVNYYVPVDMPERAELKVRLAGTRRTFRYRHSSQCR